MNENKILLLGNLHSGTVGTRGVGEDLAEKLEANEWSVTMASKYTNRFIKLLDMVQIIIRKRACYNVAYVEVYSGFAFIWAEITTFFLRLLGKPFVVTLHGGNLPVFAKRWPGRVKRLLNSANAVTTPSSYLLSTFKSTRSDIILLANAVDLSLYQFEHRATAEPHVAWLRAFHSIYNPILAAKVIAHLKSEFPSIHLTMFGPDKNDGTFEEVQTFILESGILENVHIAGSIPKAEVPHRLAAFDIFINTTTAESFGVAVVEAAALGMCIVSTRVGEIPYIWTHEHDALLVDPDNPVAMADAIRRILTEPGLAERLSHNARKKQSSSIGQVFCRSGSLC